MGILTPLNIESLRKDFPILKQQVNGKNLVYLDNGATSQKPQVVVGALSRYYEAYNANVHRGVHHLSQLATQAQEDARKIVAQHINTSFFQNLLFRSYRPHLGKEQVYLKGFLFHTKRQFQLGQTLYAPKKRKNRNPLPARQSQNAEYFAHRLLALLPQLGVLIE